MGGNKSKLKVLLGNESVKVPEVKVSTFKKIEKEMDMSRTQTLKLEKILKKDVAVEKGVRKLRQGRCAPFATSRSSTICT